MIPEYEISIAAIADAESILELQKLAFLSEAEIHNNFEIPPLVQGRESIKEDFNTYQFYKLLSGDKIIGAVKVRLLENNLLWIGRLAVHPEFQNRGYGKLMMRFVEREFDSVSGFELFTSKKSIRNVHFYESLGYRNTGTYSEPGHSNIELIRMEKQKPQITR